MELVDLIPGRKALLVILLSRFLGFLLSVIEITHQISCVSDDQNISCMLTTSTYRHSSQGLCIRSPAQPDVLLCLQPSWWSHGSVVRISAALTSFLFWCL
ncbi:hypothetical protein GDO81_025385 [Engystomops pustulosus]|uniref:Uncharacterized protein n=1 Tax=Engystomops pustulosus TaxID=76066 RepID=A0AAV6ZPG2_ENGPU|nr:hypothetical protein GDO81_025385 [Engystomops pustulosus]